MAYTVDSTKVAAAVATFPAHVLKSWNACLAEISVDPFARFGFYVDRVVPIAGFPLRTWVYEIAQETSISGEVVFVFAGDFFPQYSPVYIVDEERKRVLIIHLRENRRS